MNKLYQAKRIYLLIASYLIILFSVKNHTPYKTPKITYNNSFNIEYDNTYATYYNKEIIIGSKDYIKSIGEYNDNTIYIIDERDGDDPDMSIYDSYKIFNAKTRKDILNILLEYEDNNPTKWDRTYKSMYNEWLLQKG